MKESIAVKLAEHLGNIAAHARVKRALDVYTQKQAKGNADFLYGGGGGALLGALAGGGSTALTNMFRKKQDRKSVLNNALMGGLGGGALGLGLTSIYKGLNDPASPPQEDKDINKRIAEIQKNDTAYNDPIKELTAPNEHAGYARLLASAGLGGYALNKGSQRDTMEALHRAYDLKDSQFKADIDKLAPTPEARRDLFNRIATRRSYLSNPVINRPSDSSGWDRLFSNTAKPDAPKPLRASDIRGQAFTTSRLNNLGRPMAGRMAGGFSLAAPYLIDPFLRVLGITPDQIITGEDQFRRRANYAELQAEREAARARK